MKSLYRKLDDTLRGPVNNGSPSFEKTLFLSHFCLVARVFRGLDYHVKNPPNLVQWAFIAAQN
jgi:hypothetical protein